MRYFYDIETGETISLCDLKINWYCSFTDKDRNEYLNNFNYYLKSALEYGLNEI